MESTTLITVESRRTGSEIASPEERRAELTTAETAECQCPDFCERDHDLD
jgi:hypothetical protein